MSLTGYFSFLYQEEQYFSTISGYVFDDVNGNGVFDAGETILGNVNLNLFDESGLIASNTSGPDGLYSFVVSQAGTYLIEEVDPDSWYSTTPNGVEVVIESRYAQRLFVDFGDKPFNASIIGVVFDDSDFDGVRDPEEVGLPGVGVGIYVDDRLLSQTDTDVGGVFLFTLYNPGIYEVVETDTDGWESTTDNSAIVEIESISGDVFEVSFGDTDAEKAEIVCVVFNDTDADGVKGVDEGGILGVSVEIYDSDGFVSSQETGADGVCYFSMEQIGEYLVVETISEGWFNTTTRDARVVVSSPFSEVVDVEFGETLGASIRGKVFDDDNADSMWAIDEDGLEGVNVSLYRDDVFVVVFNTEDSGNFSFFLLEPGNYHLNETDPIGWNSTTPNIVNVTVELLSGQEYYILFGDNETGPVKPTEPEEPEPEEPEPAIIHGIVFHDTNNNEEKEFFENGISGVTVRLYEGENLVAVNTTDPGGSYDFSGLELGVYEVVETDLSGWYSVTPNRVEITVEEGESVRVDFADDIVPPPPPPPQYGSISGLVFNDLDGDGEYDPDELGLENVIVSLYSNSPISSDTTDSNGAFSFSSLTVGSYRVMESDPTGWYSTTPNSVELTVSANKVTKIVFGDKEYPSVWGYAFNDTDGNGEKGEEELGIPGVNVSANFGGEVLNSTTGEGGYYLFDDLNYIGPFDTTADLPDGHLRTTPSLVFWDLYDGDDKNVNFGYASIHNAFGVVYGTVFDDENHNGIPELGESGIPEVTVQLYYETGLIDEMVTNYYGQYTLRTSFSGPHDLTEFDLPGYVSTTPNNLSVSLTTGSSGPSPVDFGDFYGTKITGKIFNDTNVNGVLDAESGLPGALVSCGG
ncbi:MAG: SdrD B-like domain-containing protein, partial [Candidatus Thorarchaeota archaeon]